LKKDMEKTTEEYEKFYHGFEAILSGLIPFNSPQAIDLVKEFSLQPTTFQKRILKEIIKNNGEMIIPLTKHLLGQDEKLSEVIVNILSQKGNEAAAHILSRFAQEIGGKRIEKLVKKAFYHLRLKGVRCPDLKEEERPVFRKISLPKAEAYISHIDGLGDRLVVLAIPESLALFITYSFLINDQVGIKDVQEVLLKKKELNSYLSGEDRQYPITMVEVDYSYCQYLLHLAYQKNLEKATPLPANFTTRHKTLFHAVSDEKKPLIANVLKREDVEQNQALLDHASDIFETPEIKGWNADEHFISEYRYKIENLSLSSLIVSKVAKEERIESIINEATLNFFNPEQRQLYKRRLEETAYIFWKTNRKREAEISMAIAFCLIDDNIPLEVQFFPRELIRRSLLSDSKEKEMERNSRIIIPNSRVII